MKALQGHHLKAVGTVRNYEQALTRVAEYVKAERLPHGLRGLTPAQALSYLEKRGQDVGQKTLDMERQAIQSMFHHVTGQLAPDERLTVVKSAHQQVLTSRGYTPAQIHLIVDAQTTRNALATELAYAAGLRAHELYTLQPAHERPAHVRPALDSKWQGRDGVLYTVHGKGGLVRHVLIPLPLAERLKTHRLATPQSVTDRGIHYQQHYAINGGHRWSSAFTSASQRVLGWSAGAHGLRHTYAQERMHELQRQGLTRIHALETVSQEMGHFRPDITETYLR
ncbi:MAG: hypothetical protein WCE62_14960 [Polyangiales bacterium]